MDHTITIYEEVGHAFIQPDSYKEGKTQTVNAWNQITQFLATAFTKSGAASPSGLEAPTAASLSHIVPLYVSLYHRLACASKCAEDHLFQTGHGHDADEL